MDRQDGQDKFILILLARKICLKWSLRQAQRPVTELVEVTKSGSPVKINIDAQNL
jgi:hypothetical protein